MRVLFEDKIKLLENTDFSVTYGNNNYPSYNLKDAFLNRKFKTDSTSNDSEITIDLGSSQTFDCLFAANYYSDNGIKIEYIDSSVVQHTENLTSVANEDIETRYFTAVDADEIKITFQKTGATEGYMFGFGSGEYYELPEIVSSFKLPFTDNTDISRSPNGQVLRNYVRPLRKFRCNFFEINRETRNLLEEEFLSFGIGNPSYFDFFEEKVYNSNTENYLPPLYCSLDRIPTFDKNGRMFNFNISVTEAK